MVWVLADAAEVLRLLPFENPLLKEGCAYLILRFD